MFRGPTGPDFTFKFLVVEVHLEHLLTASCSKQTGGRRGGYFVFVIFTLNIGLVVGQGQPQTGLSEP